MKKEVYIIVLIIILMSTSVSAFEKLYDKYVYEGDTFTVEQDVYYSALTIDKRTLILHKNTELFFIKNGTCEETTYYQYCFMGLKLDIPTYGRWNQERFAWDSAIKVEIYSKKPSLEVTRTISETKVDLGEKAKISIEIKNNGKLRIDNIFFQEVIPKGVEIVSQRYDYLELKDRTFVWKGYLYPNETISFSYSVKTISYNKTEFSSATVSYHYEELDYTKGLSKLTLEVDSPYTYSEEFKPADLNWGETMTYTMTVKNTDEKDRLNLDFNLQIPKDFEIISYPLYLSRSSSFHHTESLKPGESFSMTFKFKSSYAGVFQSVVKNALTIRDEVYEKNKVYIMTIRAPELKPSIVLSKKEVLEGGPYTVFAYIENPSGVNYYDVKGVLKSDLFGEREISLGIISPNKKGKLIEEQLRAIPVDKETIFNISFEGSYRTHLYQSFDFSTSTVLKVKPVQTGFNIRREVSPKEVKAGEEVTIKVFAENLGQSYTPVVISDSFPANMIISGGKSEKSLTLNPGQEQEVYIYKIQIPVDTQEDFIVTTTLNYENLLTTRLNTTINVKPLEKKEEEDKTKIDEIVIVEKEEKPGFFKKIFTAIKNLFS
ncbi:MAG: hypothetical protein ABIC91_00160 [Nanoarchaeota archaeon]|nr:hypothetical protein [Nanoarchaeota archaeon]